MSTVAAIWDAHVKDMGWAVCGSSSRGPAQEVTSDMKSSDTLDAENQHLPQLVILKSHGNLFLQVQSCRLPRLTFLGQIVSGKKCGNNRSDWYTNPLWLGTDVSDWLFHWVEFIIPSVRYRLCETPMLRKWDGLFVAPPSEAQCSTSLVISNSETQ